MSWCARPGKGPDASLNLATVANKSSASLHIAIAVILRCALKARLEG
jgi:hypothetical protein